ncbi:MAG: hypothetical protein D6761_11705 [Candidatus Dadabacteria bacterium]|nr:MAG: hypothetical protein D6761_11705 [Candidatus Dadabacteria bacterium]
MPTLRRFAGFLGLILCALVVSGDLRAAEESPEFPLGVASSRRGEIGLMRTGSAIVMPQNSFSILGTMDYWKMKDFFADGLEQERLENRVGLAFSLTEFWELFVSASAVSHLLKDTVLDDQILAQTIGDFLLGSKWAFNIKAQPWLWLGFDFASQFRTKRGGIGPQLSATGIDTRFLMTFDWTTRKVEPKPVRMNLNFGWMHDNAYKLIGQDQTTGDPISRYALGIPYDDDAWLLGFGLEVPQPYFDFFFEFYTRQFVDVDGDQPPFLPKRTFKQNEIFLIPGVRLFPVAGLHIDLAFDLGHNLFASGARYDIQGLGLLHKVEPDWMLHGGIGYVFLPPKPELPKEGRIEGVIYDARDRSPVAGAVITFPGTNMTALVTREDGRYLTYQFPVGPVKVRVDAKNYQSAETTVNVVPGQNTKQDFVLQYAEQAGELIGQISNPDGQGLPGVIEIKEKGVGPITADQKTGQFQAKLKPGVYTLRAVVPGYDPQLKRVRVANKRRTVVNFVLKPSKIVGTLKGSSRDAEGTPVPATITFDKPGIAPLNVDPATGTFEVQLPPGVYKVRAMAPGYDPSEKAVKIAKDAITVVDFVMQEAKKTGKVIGTVVDAKTRKGVYGVISFPNGEYTNIPTDPDSGKFVVELDEGVYQIKAANPSYRPVVLDVKVEKGRETNVTFELKPYQKLRVTDEKIEIKDTIKFQTGKATIKIESYPILDEIAQVLKENPDMRLVIEGHTDSVGDASINRKLSQKRAEAVRDYLISRGVSPKRLEAVGFGEDRPIADNSTAEGRAKNRRVEFKIVK